MSGQHDVLGQSRRVKCIRLFAPLYSASYSNAQCADISPQYFKLPGERASATETRLNNIEWACVRGYGGVLVVLSILWGWRIDKMLLNYLRSLTFYSQPHSS